MTDKFGYTAVDVEDLERAIINRDTEGIMRVIARVVRRSFSEMMSTPVNIRWMG